MIDLTFGLEIGVILKVIMGGKLVGRRNMIWIILCRLWGNKPKLSCAWTFENMASTGASQL